MITATATEYVFIILSDKTNEQMVVAIDDYDQLVEDLITCFKRQQISTLCREANEWLDVADTDSKAIKMAGLILSTVKPGCDLPAYTRTIARLESFSKECP